MRAALLLFLALASAACDRSKAVPSGGAPALDADAGPVTATPLLAERVEELVNPDKLPVYTGPTGSIEGTIYVKGPQAAETPATYLHGCASAGDTYGRAFREGTPATPGGPRWLADAVVAVTGYSGFYLPEQREAKELSIEGCAFDRRTATVTFGQLLEIKNVSKEFWTPKLLPAPVGMLRMAPPGGEAIKIVPSKPGRFRLVDHDRKYAVVDVFAFLHPLHTASSAAGTYRIDGVPVGKVTVHTSHPQIPGVEASVEVDVVANVVHREDLTIEQKAPGAPAPATAP